MINFLLDWGDDYQGVDSNIDAETAEMLGKLFNFVVDVLGWIDRIVAVLAMFAFAYNIFQLVIYGPANPMLREKQKHEAIRALIVLGVCGAIPAVYQFILALVNFFTGR